MTAAVRLISRLLKCGPRPVVSILMEALRLGIMGIVTGFLTKVLRKGQENVVDRINMGIRAAP